MTVIIYYGINKCNRVSNLGYENIVRTLFFKNYSQTLFYGPVLTIN